MKRIFPSSLRAGLAALVACCSPALAWAAPNAPSPVPPDAHTWQPSNATARDITDSLTLEMNAGGSGAVGKKPVAMRFDRLGRVPVQFVGALDAASVAPATVWVVNLDKPDAALSCGANPVRSFVIETEPSPEKGSPGAGLMNLYGLDQTMASVPNIKRLPTACFWAEYSSQ